MLLRLLPARRPAFAPRSPGASSPLFTTRDWTDQSRAPLLAVRASYPAMLIRSSDTPLRAAARHASSNSAASSECSLAGMHLLDEQVRLYASIMRSNQVKASRSSIVLMCPRFPMSQSRLATSEVVSQSGLFDGVTCIIQETDILRRPSSAGQMDSSLKRCTLTLSSTITRSQHIPGQYTSCLSPPKLTYPEPHFMA